MTRRLAGLLSLSAAIGLAAASYVPGADDRSEAMRHYKEGQAALRSERWAEAEEGFRLATLLDPLFVGAYYGLGQTHMATKRYPDAVDAYTAAEKAFHDQQAETITNRLETEKRIDDQIKALEDDIRAAQRQMSGSNASRIQAAIARVESQVDTLRSLRRRQTDEQQPTPHWLSLALGSAYFRNQNLEKAEEAYRAAVEVKPDLGEAHQNLAVVYMITGRLDQAEQEVELAEEAGFRVHPGLKKDIEKRKGAAQ